MEELEQYRKKIDDLDIKLIDILARRFDIVRSVGKLKAKTGLSIVQAKRAEAVKIRAATMGQEKGLDPAFIRDLYTAMIDHAHKLENEILIQEKD